MKIFFFIQILFGGGLLQNFKEQNQQERNFRYKVVSFVNKRKVN
jgi:hypothetical protein